MTPSRNKSEDAQGSITIFLAMIFLLIVAVVLVTLESARVTAVKSSMSMAMYQSMDSVLADFYLPLFEEYQIFGRYEEKATDSMIKNSLETNLLESLQYASNPVYDLEDIEGSLHAVLPAKIRDIKVKNITYLDDYESDAFYLQAVEAVKFYGIETFLDTMLEKCNLLSESAGASEAFSMQSEVIESLAELDEVTMELMELIDGIVLKEGKLQVTQGEMLVCNGMFAKKYVMLPTSMADVKINHAVVFESLRQEYINKYAVYSECIEMVQQLIETQRKINEKEALYASLGESSQQLSQEVNGLQVQYQELNRGLQGIQARIAILSLAQEQNRASIVALQAEARAIEETQAALSQTCNRKEEAQNDLREHMNQLSQEMQVLRESKSTYRQQYATEIRKVEDSLSACQVVLLEAIEKTDEGIQKQSGAQSQVEAYEASLNELKESISEEIFTSLSEGLEGIKGYVGEGTSTSSVNYDYDQMKHTLEYNYGLLKDGIQYIAWQQVSDDLEGFQRLQQILTQNQQIMNSYSIEALEFDYSTLNLNQSSEQSVIDTMKDTISSGVLSLVLEDSSTVSDRRLDRTQLPSTLAGVLHTDISIEEQSQQLSVLDKSLLGDLLDSFSKLFSNEGSLASFATEIVQLGLLQVYLQEYFKDYTVEGDAGNQTVLYPSVLNYEKEYMCFHQESDKENLTSMIYTLFFIRLVVNMISLFSNSECNEKARVTATALVAFTGLTILVSVTKMLILTAWAVIETLIDVAALLQGKDLAVLNWTTQHMSYAELLTVNRTVILQKASEYQTTSSITMDYDQYLFVFLLMQSKQSKCYSAMDLIQTNLNYRYEGNFELSRCIYEFKAEFDYLIKHLYAIGIDFNGGLSFKKTIQLSY